MLEYFSCFPRLIQHFFPLGNVTGVRNRVGLNVWILCSDLVIPGLKIFQEHSTSISIDTAPEGGIIPQSENQHLALTELTDGLKNLNYFGWFQLDPFMLIPELYHLEEIFKMEQRKTSAFTFKRRSSIRSLLLFLGITPSI